MKAFITAIITIGCISILILGNIHWGNKTTVSSAKKVESTEHHYQEEVEKHDEPTYNEEDISRALTLAANWPEEGITRFEESLRSNKPFHILIAGSTSLGDGPTSWPEIVKQSLYDTYGEEIVTVSIEIFDKNTKEFLEEGKNKVLADSNADLILFEPFTLKDNGVVVIEDSLFHIESILDSVKESNPETIIILQPPHPITGSSWYPVQVRELEKFATTNGIHYLNHWEAWPEQTSDYITPERDAPTDKGHEVWANYIEGILIAN